MIFIAQQTTQRPGLMINLVICLTMMAGCSSSESPEAVAQQFWQAMAAADLDAARQFATSDSMDGVSVDTDGELRNLQLGDSRVEDGLALVATEFETIADDSAVKLAFDTVLEREQGQWRVNFSRTVKSMIAASFNELKGALAGSVSEMSEAVGEAVDEAMTEAAEEMSEALQEAAQEMQKAADELRKNK